MEPWHIWVIAAMFLFILEIFTSAFVVACFGMGCLASAAAAYFGTDIKWQIGIFSLATAVVLFGIRPVFLNYCYSRAGDVKTNVDALVGQVGIVSEKIDPTDNSGRIKVGGDDWKAISTDEGKIEKGQKVKVVKVEGTKVFVEKV